MVTNARRSTNVQLARRMRLSVILVLISPQLADLRATAALLESSVPEASHRIILSLDNNKTAKKDTTVQVLHIDRSHVPLVPMETTESPRTKVYQTVERVEQVDTAAKKHPSSPLSMGNFAKLDFSVVKAQTHHGRTKSHFLILTQNAGKAMQNVQLDFTVPKVRRNRYLVPWVLMELNRLL